MTTHTVYYAHDAAGRLLYVGCTKNLEKRLEQHSRTSDWYPHHATIITDGPLDEAEALALESEAIATLAPIFNTTEGEQRELTRRRGVVNRRRAIDGFTGSRRAAENAGDAAYPCAPTKDYKLARYLNDTGQWGIAVVVGNRMRGAA